MIEIVKQFHFIRPWVLTVLILVAIIYWRLRHQSKLSHHWAGIIRPHLLKHLAINRQDQEKLKPRHVLGIAMVLIVLALAGPAWHRQKSPFTEDTAPLVIALDMSETMNIRDIQPSRLQRGKQKIRDLLALRGDGRTALLCYAGSAHMVLPLTEDTQFITTYLESLSRTYFALLTTKYRIHVC